VEENEGVRNGPYDDVHVRSKGLSPREGNGGRRETIAGFISNQSIGSLTGGDTVIPNNEKLSKNTAERNRRGSPTPCVVLKFLRQEVKSLTKALF